MGGVTSVQGIAKQTGYRLELDTLHADRRGNDVLIKRFKIKTIKLLLRF